MPLSTSPAPGPLHTHPEWLESRPPQNAPLGHVLKDAVRTPFNPVWRGHQHAAVGDEGSRITSVTKPDSETPASTRSRPSSCRRARSGPSPRATNRKAEVPNSATRILAAARILA